MSDGERGRPTWSSNWMFSLVAVGAAVGLGSIWRLPYLVGTGGGSAFIFVFVLACLLIATPLLAAEFLIGRRARTSPPRAAGVVAEASGRSLNWNAIGALGTLATLLIMATYAVVAAWVLAYAWKCLSGQLAGLSRPEVDALWQDFQASPWEMGAWHLAFLALLAFISARGLARGIEMANKVRAPSLLALLLVLVVYSLNTGDVARGLAFAFAPNFAAITPPVVLAAVGQAFYATGVGMAMMLAYGAYVPRGASLVKTALAISGSILLVSLLATLMIFPLVFQYGMDPAGGTALVFEVLPKVFAEMPAGRPVGSLFFLLLVFAALTPSLAGIEPVVAWIEGRFGLRRAQAALAAVGACWVLGIGCVLSFNTLSSWHPLSFVPPFAGKTFFDLLDFLSSNVMLPVGALLTSIFVGWRVSDRLVAEELAESTPAVRRLTVGLLRYACPLAIVAIFASTLF